MVKHLFSLIISFTALVFSSKAQNSSWREGLGRADGFTEIKGIQIQFTESACEKKSVVFIKIINNNDYAVELTWEDAILDSDNTWLKNKNLSVKSIAVNANETIQGSCEGKLQQLIANPDEFSDKNNFKYFRAAQLNINPISK